MKRMINQKKILCLALCFAFLLLLPGCGKKNAAAEPAASGEALRPAATAAPAVSAEAPEVEAEPERQDGERFETVILLEGMEETVRYEHVRNETAGFALDYDYEALDRRSDTYRERFLSCYDDPEDPWNYLELSYNAKDADSVAAIVQAGLEAEFGTVSAEPFTLDRAGGCLRLSASDARTQPGALRTVYVIPAADGCRVATVHCTVESAEGFGARFADMLHTLTVMDSRDGGKVTDELALEAVMRYCCLGNPELEDIVKAGEYPAYWELSSSDEAEVVVLFRSYTGAQLRYYIDRNSGNTTVTEFVPGITPEEMPTDESLNVWDCLARA